jgi:hypothetical protein
LYLPGRRANAGHYLRLHTVTGKVHPLPGPSTGLKHCSEAIDRWRRLESAKLHLDEPEHRLEELALMTVAAKWLTLWQPISVHRATLAGVTPGQVSDAAGMSIRDTCERWQKWPTFSGTA